MTRQARVIAALGLLVAMSGCKQSYQSRLDALPTEGLPIPAFDLPLLSGEVVRSTDLRGNTVVVALWSTTCGASRLALESMAALNDEYATRGIRMLVVADDADASSVQSVLDGAGVHLQVALAAGRISSILAPSRRRMWMPGIALPAFLVIDSDGVVRHRVIGVEQDPAHRMERLRHAVDAIEAEHRRRRAE